MNAGNPVFWIARADGPDGVIRGGIVDEADPLAWACILTPQGWRRVPGTTDPPMGLDDAGEALIMLAGKCHDAGLHHCSVDTAPWPDAPGPWRMEATFRVLWPEDGP